MSELDELSQRLFNVLKDAPPLSDDPIGKLKRASAQVVYGYVRVSTPQQVKDGHSLEAQETAIRRYCDEHDLPEPVVMGDEGISGKSTDNRDNFNLIKSLVKPGDIFISYSLSRVGRNTLDVLEFAKFLEDLEVRLICLDKQIDTSKSEGRLFFTMMTAFNQFEREQAAERVSMVMQDMSQSGNLHTRGRFGYRVENNTLVPIPEEQKVIETIFLLICRNPAIKTCDVVREIQERVDAGELLMRVPKKPKPGKNHSYGKKVYQTTITNIIKANHLREMATKISKSIATSCDG